MIDAFITADGELTMKNIKNYQATLVMTNTNEFTLFDDTDSVDIPVNSIAFIEKGIKFNVRVKKQIKKKSQSHMTSVLLTGGPLV